MKLTDIEIPWNDVPEEIRKIAIKARTNFINDDYLLPVLIVSGGGEEHIIDVSNAVPHAMDAVETLMISFAKKGATLLVLIAEAWMARGEQAEKLTKERRLKDAPGRWEVIHVSAETPQAWYSLKARIQRDRKLRVLDYDCWRMTREDLTEMQLRHPTRLQNIFHKANV